MTDTSESLSTSTQSNATNLNLSEADNRMQMICKQMLKSRTFLGHYQENRLVESLQSYRGLVVISKSDESLSKEIKLVRDRIKSFYSTNPKFWVGFTDSDMIGVPNGACIWTEMDNVAFGEYWFQIKTVRFRNNEALIKLKVLRPMDNIQASIKLEENIKKQNMLDTKNSAETFQKVLETWHKETTEYLLWFVSQITPQNIVAAFKFVSLILLALGTLSLRILMYMGAFTLRFLEEFRKTFHVLTPFILRLIDIVNNIIGGFFILISMIWKDMVGRNSTHSQNVQRPIMSAQAPVRTIQYRQGMRNSEYYNSRFRQL